MGANYLIVNSLGCNDGRVTCPYVTGWLIGPYPPHSRACRDTRPYRGTSEMAFFMVDIAAVRQFKLKLGEIRKSRKQKLGKQKLAAVRRAAAARLRGCSWFLVLGRARWPQRAA